MSSDHEPVITTPKVLDLAPTWADFFGWTLLYRNPCNRSWRDRTRLYAPPCRRHLLYRRIAGAAARLEAEFEDQPIAWLPPSSYHVTLMDGLSEAHEPAPGWPDVTSVIREGEFGADPAARLFPGATDAIHQLLATVAASRNTFVLGAIRCRGHAVLAEIEPAKAAVDDCSTVTASRDEALVRLGDACGLDLRTDFRPHITLGYVANKQVARTIGPAIEEAAAPIVAGRPTGAETITYRRAGLFVYRSMVDYRAVTGFD